MKPWKLRSLSILIYIFFGFVSLFFIPQATYAQNGDCGTDPPRIDLPIYIYDAEENANRWGATGSACTDDRFEGVRIGRVSGSRNIYFTCGTTLSGKTVSNAFVAESWRCDNGNFVFDIIPPSGFDCNYITWRFYDVGTLGSSSSGDATNPPTFGSGCRVTVPYQGNNFDDQVIVRMNYPDPNRTSYTCNPATNPTTVTLGWTSVPRASSYGWRLNNMNDGWFTAGSDSYGFTTSTNATMPIRFDTDHQWTVTSLNAAGQGQLPRSWTETFRCRLPDPVRISHTCNNNQTVTLRWNSVTNASEYGWRLNNRSNIWYTPPSDTFGYTNSTTATVPLTYGQSYEWAVTASTVAGQHPTASSWSGSFICPAPVASCTDTDGGNNPLVAGSVNSNVNGVGFDFCTGNTLTEQYCNNASTRVSTTHQCAYRCINNQCVPPPAPAACGTTSVNNPARSIFSASMNSVPSSAVSCQLNINGVARDIDVVYGSAPNRYCLLDAAAPVGIFNYSTFVRSAAGTLTTCETNNACGDITAPPPT